MQGGCCEEQAARTSSAGNAGIALGPVRARDRRSPRLSPLGGPGAEEPSNGASSSPPELELAFAAMLRRVGVAGMREQQSDGAPVQHQPYPTLDSSATPSYGMHLHRSSGPELWRHLDTAVLQTLG